MFVCLCVLCVLCVLCLYCVCVPVCMLNAHMCDTYVAMRVVYGVRVTESQYEERGSSPL